MRKVEQKTIENYGRFLKVIADLEGKEADLQKILRAFHLPNSTLAYARKLGFLDYNGNKITKVAHRNPDPIIARKLIDGMNKIKRENAERKLQAANPRLPEKINIKETIPSVVEPRVAKKKEIYAEKKTPTIPSKNIKEQPREKSKKKIVKIFGIPVVTIELL